jgi:hypothetical protein
MDQLMTKINIQIPNSKQSVNPNFQDSKHSKGLALVLHTFLFGDSYLFGVWLLRFGISASDGKWVK